MSVHSYSRCWLHLVWGTHRREGLLPREAAMKVSHFLGEYAASKDIDMKINFVNADHVHVLIDLPTSLAIEEAVRLLKGEFLPLDQCQQHYPR